MIRSGSHSDVSRSHRCRSCGETFAMVAGLTKHRQAKHPKDNQRPKADDVLPCRKGCTAKFKTEYFRAKHEREFHSPEYSFVDWKQKGAA